MKHPHHIGPDMRCGKCGVPFTERLSQPCNDAPVEPVKRGPQKRHGTPLSHLRIRRGWTQNVLATRSGVSFRTVSDVETRAHLPTLETREKLLRALGEERLDHFDVFGPLPVKSRWEAR